MKSAVTVAAFAAAIIVSVAPLVASDGAEGHPWGYRADDEDFASPDKWYEYYPTCSGERQSPIDIVPSEDNDWRGPPFYFDGECSNYQLSQTSEGYKVAVNEGSCTVQTPNALYNFLQFHMHTPSEHTLSGQALDGEMHFVHRSANDEALLVVGLFFIASEGATTDSFFADVLNAMDSVDESTPADLRLTSYSSLLHSTASGYNIFNYPGSLTTPSCDETVDWWVIQHPLTIATADLERLQNHFKKIAIYDDGKNARPVQPLNGRKIVSYDA